MKKIFICLLMVLLCGCTNQNNDVISALDEVFSEDVKNTNYYPNSYTEVMDYYIPSDMQEMDANKQCTVLKYNDDSIVMNVNISGVITYKYYNSSGSTESLFDISKLYYSRTGVYCDGSGELVYYRFNVYSYDKDYLLLFSSKNINIYGYSCANDVVPVSSRMLLLAKGVNIREESIISKYSSKEVIDYERQQVDLFQSTLPVNGRIDEMLVQKDDVVADTSVE
ncbi:MAG: hypothetical protein Q4D13_08960 [Erysipelotrichaceae bacterium]|nr:hypothetical protein [Erysipelotrichaceae bacterium]